MRTFLRHPRLAGLMLSILLGLTARFVVSAQQSQQRSLDSTPDRMVLMDHHFSNVSVLHTALIRGDLAAALRPARELAVMSVPPAVPAAAISHVEAIRAAARRAANATAIGDAATAAATMLQHCGECHRQVGVFPALREGGYETASNISAHMREHKRGLDQMLYGLVVPSSQQWLEGARRLSQAELESDKLPSDRAMTKTIREGETRVHEIAERATRADDAADRTRLYAELVTTCASCHALRKDWGPAPVPPGAGR